MRESLLHKFDSIWIDNLNGDKYRTGKIVPRGLPGEGSSDQSVFTTEQDSRGIQVGTAITTLLKRNAGRSRKVAAVYYRDFWGLSLAKREALLRSLRLDQFSKVERRRLAVLPAGPRDYEPVTPSVQTRWKLVPARVTGGYEDWPAVDELFPVNFQGVNPNRGLADSVIDTDSEALVSRMRDYFSDMPFEKVRERHPELLAPRAGYDPKQVREQLLGATTFRPKRVVEYLLFPLDSRVIYYEDEGPLLNRRRPELWENLSENIFLVTVPQPRRVSESRPLIASSLFDLHLHDRGSVGFPARVSHTPGSGQRGLFSDGPQANLASEAWAALKKGWHLRGGLDGKDALRFTRDLFFLIIALAHAPRFEDDHQSAIAQDWLHLPIPKEKALFSEVARLGERLSLLLDPYSDPTRVLTEILGPARSTLGVVSHREEKVVREGDLVVTVSYFGSAQGGWKKREPLGDEGGTVLALGGSTGDLWLNDMVFLRNVPERVWRYELGGYPVIKKWLGYRVEKRRPGRRFTLGELNHLRGMIHRLAALLLLHDRLDAAYEKAIADPFTVEELGLGS